MIINYNQGFTLALFLIICIFFCYSCRIVFTLNNSNFGIRTDDNPAACAAGPGEKLLNMVNSKMGIATNFTDPITSIGILFGKEWVRYYQAYLYNALFIASIVHRLCVCKAP